MMRNDLARIRRASGIYRRILSALIPVVPAAVIVCWALFNQLPEGFRADLPAAPVGVLHPIQIVLAILITSLPAAVGLFALMTLRSLCGLYAQGAIFTAANVTCYRRLGYALLAWVTAGVFYTPLISAVLTYANGTGQRMLVLNLGVSDLSTLIIGGVVLMVAWVMD